MLLRCLDEAQITLVDQVGKTQSLVLILLCDRNDKSQVGIDKLIKRCLVSLANALCEFDLLINRNEFLTADFLKILVK